MVRPLSHRVQPEPIPSRAKALRVGLDHRAAEVQLAGSSAERTQRVRTDHADTYAEVNPGADGAPVQYARTDLPGIVGCAGRVRTVQTGTAERPLGPEGSARKAVAGHLAAALERRWAGGEEWASGRAVAAKCAVDERIVRQWRSGETAIPLAALLVLPPSIASELVTFVLEKRGLANRRALPMLREALLRLEADVAENDVSAMRDALTEAMGQIVARLGRLSGAGR